MTSEQAKSLQFGTYVVHKDGTQGRYWKPLDNQFSVVLEQGNSDLARCWNNADFTLDPDAPLFVGFEFYEVGKEPEELRDGRDVLGRSTCGAFRIVSFCDNPSWARSDSYKGETWRTTSTGYKCDITHIAALPAAKLFEVKK